MKILLINVMFILLLLLHSIASPLVRLPSIVISLYVWMSVCLLTRPNCQFSVRCLWLGLTALQYVVYFWFFLWVMSLFSHEVNGPECFMQFTRWRHQITLFCRIRQLAALGAKSAKYDCIFLALLCGIYYSCHRFPNGISVCWLALMNINEAPSADWQIWLYGFSDV